MHLFFSHLGTYSIFEVRQNKGVRRGTNHRLLHQGLWNTQAAFRASAEMTRVNWCKVKSLARWLENFTFFPLTCKVKVVPCCSLWKVFLDVDGPLVVTPTLLPCLQNGLLQIDHLHPGSNDHVSKTQPLKPFSW